MTTFTRDPLLAIARALLMFLIAVMGLGALACVVAVPAVIVAATVFHAEIVAAVPDIPVPTLLAGAAVVCILAAAMLACIVRMFLLLLRIVDTVGEGDPFVPVNASRLTQMAWLTLAVQVITIPLAVVGIWMASVADSAEDVNVHTDLEAGLSGNGLLLMLILFILARVFRQGAAMRADLEGTV